ncbi:hypothetical protein AQJ43_04620 [Streptomyces avermitilis]|nr:MULTISPECIES: DUF6303 family protein [Streptomyces]KUN57152.1 hypothetical protein AQJ43_04620 [Streptomyces avermitilis]MYS99310.1 hypothetical protein [Streptomyces sp. SID5469]OOV33642.1 hypothetical protein SM007_06130 [Streptomyces avermitilis]BBJ51633.1 hypothetical protein SAVMC3_42620 [Streptomyces avermitilis]GDY63673.1 hypothetical protein SAV14893_030660 [Streptomyces avermitilis]
MARELRAQLSASRGGWRLYVVVRGSVEPWLEHCFGPGDRLLTFTERARALTALGFVQAPAAEWEWTEFSTDPADPASPVWLLASVLVRSRQEAAA